jgi:hypothetical protein
VKQAEPPGHESRSMSPGLVLRGSSPTVKEGS